MATLNELGKVTRSRPVVVVGGGIAGLTAAWELRRRGVPVQVIESAPRAGGRICTLGSRVGSIETGMQFYYSSYRQTRRLLREFGLERDLVPIHVRGKMFYQGRIEPFSKTRPWLKLLSAKENFSLQRSVARQIFRILRLDPFGFRHSDVLDQVDVSEYFTRRCNETILEVAARPLVNSYAFCEPEGHSLSMMLRIVKLGGLASTHGLRRGNGSLPVAMAERLGVVRGRATEILLDEGTAAGVRIEGEGGTKTLPASHVICALRAPQAAQVLGASPELSHALGSLDYSSVLLANLHLDRPITGPDWVYVFSRKASHQAAFALDLTRRSPTMFPSDKSVLQVNFASPASDGLIGQSDEAIVRAAVEDLRSFLPEIGGWINDTHIVRRPKAMPSFRCGMYGAVRKIEEIAATLPGLSLVGDYLRSPLCEGAVRSATDCVGRLTGVKRVRRAEATRALEACDVTG